MKRVSIIAVPFDSGVRDARMGRGPDALLRGGLGERLARAGAAVRVARVELPTGAFAADPGVAFALHGEIARRVADARRGGDFPLVLAGNCNTAVGTVAGMLAAGGPAPAVCWFDAHADFNTPETTTSGFVDGMALAMLTGRCWRSMTGRTPWFRPVPEESVVLVGARDLDPAEERALREAAVRRVSSGAMHVDVERALLALRPMPVEAYVHVDLDVLDPSSGRANSFAAPGGPSAAALTDALLAIRRRVPLGALALTAYDPEVDADGRVAEVAGELVVRLLGEPPGS